MAVDVKSMSLKAIIAHIRVENTNDCIWRIRSRVAVIRYTAMEAKIALNVTVCEGGIFVIREKFNRITSYH